MIQISQRQITRALRLSLFAQMPRISQSPEWYMKWRHLFQGDDRNG